MDGPYAALAFILIVGYAIHGGIKAGVTSVFHPPPPPKEKPPKIKLPKPEPEAPEGKMWVRVGKQDLLVPSELAQPRRPATRRKTRPTKRKVT